MKRITLLSCALLLGISLAGWAQESANLVGLVSDSTGAVIPGAKVVVENADKGFHRDFVSNASGEWAAPRIPIGDYVVTVEAPGFQKLVRSGITLAVGQMLRVDVQMKVGQISQEITVTGNLARVETETAAISGVVTGTQIANLELNGRNWVTLATLVPGAAPDNGLDTSHVGVYGNNNISFNGGRMQYNNWEIDGGPNTDEGSAGTFNTYPSLDTIAEFRISTSNYGADMGKHAGATIEVVTKSGTKDFHGSAFEYVRNDKFDANDWFVNRDIAPAGGNAPKTPRKWNDFGYNIGGPVFIPGHYNTGKDKTFFYWSQNWRRYREGQVISHFAPTQRMRQGDFSECVVGGPNANQTIIDQGCKVPIDPLTGLAFTGGVIPSGRINPNGPMLLNGLIPLANSGVDTFTLASSTATNWRQEQIRVDQNFGDRARLFVRYTQDSWNTLAVPALWANADYDTIKTPFGGPGKSAVLNFTYNLKPNLMNEFMMGYTVDHILLYNQVGASSPAGSINKPAGWTMQNFFPANVGNPLLPAIDVNGGIPDHFYEDAGNHPWFNSNPVITWKDNLAWTHGKHTTKFGFFLEKYRKNEQFGADTQGYLTFDGTSSISSGNGLADVFLGRIASYQEGTLTVAGVPVGGYPKGYWRMTAFEPYVQDDWKVNRKLTLNLGLRYYLFTRIHDVGKPTVDSGFEPDLYIRANEAQLNADGNLIQGVGHNYTTFGNGLVECGSGSILKGCQVPYYWTLAPRFGFAFDPTGSGKTVVRGGYGIYYEMGNGNEAQTEGGEGNPPVALGPTANNILGYAGVQPVFNNGVYNAPLPPGNFIPIPYRQKWGNVQQFSLGVQHEFRGNNVLGLSYVGSLGRELARNRNINQIPIGVGTINAPALADANHCDQYGNCDVQTILINHDPTDNADFFRPIIGYGNMYQKENTAVSNYNALQVDFRHVVGHGLTLQTSYTWAHSIDDSTNTYQGSSNGIDDYNLSRWRATSDLNRTQVLTLNYIYDLPFFRNSQGFVKTAFGGWTISGITTFMTGEPLNFGCGVSGYSTGVGTGVQCNTVGTLGVNKGVVNDTEYGPTPTWYNPAVTTQPFLSQLRADGQSGMFGYMGRNVLTGPGRNNWDLALLKNFQLPWVGGEHSNIQFRWETFNTWNHPQWNGVETGCSDSLDFGAACNTGRRGQVNGAFASRIMQLGLKFIF